MGNWCDVGEYLEVFVKKNVCKIRYLWYFYVIGFVVDIWLYY